MSLKQTFLEEAEKIFQNYPNITSFGWNQEITTTESKIEIKMTIDAPDISGVPGCYLIGDNHSIVVRDMLHSFGIVNLYSLFSTCESIQIYRDGSIEVYDTETTSFKEFS